ncbi:IS110 family transposase [Sphingomonas sp. 22176]|uniref:IS110 family transposase n=1 Tax=Sphingomonas sp. 22176 TaxID=3453884 RepID=UPI003F850DBE
MDHRELSTLKNGESVSTPDIIAAWLDRLDHDIRLIFEAINGCDGSQIAALARRGHPSSRVNPRRAREFARYTRALAKTDCADARVLARTGAALDLPSTISLAPRDGACRSSASSQ